jgi:GTP-binding protein EngB required for normal cell division
MQPKKSQESQLHQYTLAKQQIGDLLRAVMQFFEGIKEESSVEQCRALLVKLAEDRFNLAVVGQFKRGKSSLMNAVIGRELLPTGLLPLTSAITTLCYGPQELVILKRKDWIFNQEIPISELASFVTEQGNPGNEKGIQEARVEIPSPFLRRGLHFIDTPGIGSSRQENTATTYAFLPEADAVIFVTSIEAPISEAEEKFLQDIRQHAHKLFIVVNKIDLLALSERKQVLEYIRTGIDSILGASNVRIYPLSARQGLEAKLSSDGKRVQKSGMEEFETAIATFLTGEKSKVFLTAILERALRLLADFESEAGLSPRQEVELSTNNSTAPKRLQAALEILLATIQSSDEIFLTQAETDTDATVVQAPLEQAIEASQISPKTGEEQSFVMTRTCPICAAQSQAVFDFFAHWQYAVSTDGDARRAFRAARGFCRVHTWQFQQIAAPQGISEGYAPLVEAAMAELRQVVGQPPQEGAASLDTLLPTEETCPACRLLREAGVTQMNRFIALMTTAEGQLRYRRSLGICLPHLQSLLLASPSQDLADFILREQANRLEEIAEDMHSYMLKREALRRGLLNDNEEKAWLRALLLLAGERTAHALT